MNEQTKLILVAIATYLILTGYNYYMYNDSVPVAQPEEQPLTVETIPPVNSKIQDISAEVVLAENDSPKLDFASSKIAGKIHLTGGFISDVKLLDYNKELASSEPYTLLASRQGALNNFAGIAWISSNPNLVLPNENTLWQADAETLQPGVPLTLSWTSSQGIRFQIIYQLDEQYLLSVRQRVINDSKQIATIYPYSYLERRKLPDDLVDSWMVHQGINGYLEGDITEIDYDDLEDEKENFEANEGGWIAFADRYWLTSLIFSNDYLVRAEAAYNKVGYRIAFTSQAEQAVLPGSSQQNDFAIYVGVKDKNILAAYQEQKGIPSFVDAIDWGWLSIITKPISSMLDFVYNYVANYGIAIILLTFAIKAVIYPVTRSSVRMTNKMKEIKPELAIINEKFKEDKERNRVEMMKLYKKHNINPLKMVIPFFLQIPLFISFYKVLTISINLRHAPFFGWIQDLSIPDPTNFLTAFGYLDLDLPFSLQISVLSLFAGITLWLQFKFGAASSAGGSSAMIMKIMPLMLIFVFARIPAAVLLYICTSSSLTGLEQMVTKLFTKK